MTKFHFTLDTAATLSSLVWLGVGLASPISGLLSDLFKSRRLLLVFTAVLGLISFLILLYIPHLSLILIIILLFIGGIGSSGQIVSFAVIKDQTVLHRVSTAIGFNNMAEVASGLIMQPLVGKLLVLSNYSVNSQNNLHAFLSSLWVLPVCHIVCIILALFFIRESYNK